MEYWSQVIVEWINCLDVCDKPISNIDELQNDSKIYSKFIEELKSPAPAENLDQSLEISKFIKEEYPGLEIDKNDVDNTSEHVYYVSVLLISASQRVKFHKPMYSLKNDTQIIIKQFLELVLPYGKDLTFDILRESIIELADSAPKTPPMTPKERPLRTFLTSPAANSAYRYKIINQCNRELRQCKAELETAKFETIDLKEDVKKLEDRVQHLQKQLNKKNEELRALRIENTNTKTPKSCRKDKDDNLEEYLKREIKDLETHNAKLQSVINQFEEQQENLTRRLASKERCSTTLNARVSECEDKMESLINQLEIKTHELLDLRMQNEELRAHIKKIQKHPPDTEQSFEIENTPQVHLRRPSTPGLNVSEAASSIIDIQLKEAHEESEKLKHELDNVNQKLNEAIQECQEFKNLNDLLNEKVSTLDEFKMALEITEDKLEKRQCQINILEMEKKSLTDDLEKLKEAIAAKQTVLKETEENKTKVELQLSSVKEELNNLKILFDTTEDTLAQTVATKEVLVMKLSVAETKINSLEELLNTQADQHKLMKESLEEKINYLEQNISIHLEEKQRFEQTIQQKSEELENFAKDLESRNSEIHLLNDKIVELEKTVETSREKIINLENDISMNLQENKKLQETIEHQSIDLNKLSTDLDDKNSEINSLNTKIMELGQIINDLQTKILYLENNISEYLEEKKQFERTIEQKDQEFTQLSNEIENKNSENISLKHQISEIEKEKQIAHDKIHNLENNVVALSEDKERLEVFIEQKNEAFNKLTQELDNKSLENNSLQDNISRLEELKQNTESKILNLEKNVTELLQEKEQFEKIIEEKNHAIQKSCDELNYMNSEVNSLSSKLLKSEEIAKNDHEKINNLENTILRHLENEQRYEGIIKQKTEEYEGLLNEFGAKNNEIDKLKQNISLLEDKITSSEKSLSTLEMELCELRELREELQSQLANERERAAILMDNKRELESKINEMLQNNEKREIADKRKIDELNSLCELLNSDLSTAKIELAKRNSKAQELMSDRDLLQNKLNDVCRELEGKNMECKEMELQIEELKRIQERTMSSYQERENSSNEIINSLEKKLLAAQSICETLKLEKKLQEESLGVISTKLEQLTKEKIESELKMKEVIVNLQEVRTSHESVMQAQSKAFADKNLEFESLEKKHVEMKKIFEANIQQYKTQIEEKNCECESLKQTNEDHLKKINDLETDLNTERKELKIVKEKCDLLISDIDALKTFNDNYLKMIEELKMDLKTKTDNLSKLQVKCDSLSTNLEEEKKNLNEKNRCNEELLEKIDEMKSTWERRNEYLSRLVREKKSLQDLFEEIIMDHYELKDNFANIRQSWKNHLNSFKRIFVEKSSCNELQQLEAKKTEIETLMSEFDNKQLKSSKSLVQVLQKIFSCLQKNTEHVYVIPLEKLELNETDINLEDELSLLNTELEENKSMNQDFEVIRSKIDEFSNAFNSYETNIKSGTIKREPRPEEKLQNQLDQLSKEKKDLKDKLDAARVRNAKMEKTFDDLRNENKKIKAEMSAMSSEHKNEIERLTALKEELQSQVEQLQQKSEESDKDKEAKENDLDTRMKEVHNEYEQKLEKIKQKMKKAYNEQVEKIKSEQEKKMEEKVNEMQAKMDQQCKKCAEDLARYKAHVGELSSQMWNVGEKLLTEQQEKESLLQRLRDLQHRYNTTINEINHSFSLNRHQANVKAIENTFSHDRSDASTRSNFRAVQLIEEETTTTRRHSVKSIQAMGNAFNVEDEEGEVFDNIYLTDLKEGKFRAIEPASDFDRLSELRMRNSLCLPHLRSAYAVETHLHPVAMTEEDIKSGATSEDVFNDSLSQSLLPGQKAKKKDRTQGNELRSPNSRILRDRNSERRTTATPKRIKNFFGNTLSRRQDENTPATPKRRLSSMFRKSRPTEKS
ncbi:putative leucine-rich repeat-containing protein DDB_G0290503 isoform X2 [Chelonus insularis]|uniref:putative leucine-rich repeat-containing protein DDB_G0290503 isoform X2 n=1 Tax=Chelonus insularis TaxID=460826 RepID=UPI00158F4122|nr:putative leucine-rich repeat-containing protein DDB_G0290503 isoform X2 [Chelonus insularis]